MGVLPSVKAEPREAQYQPQEQEQVDHHQSLAQVDEYGGEEGYEEDYGQYEEGYAMMATAGGAEGNKGNMDNVNACIQKVDQNLYQCLKCSKMCSLKGNMVTHVENAHFPGNYHCHHCAKVFNSRNSLFVHIRRNHKESISSVRPPLNISISNTLSLQELEIGLDGKNFRNYLLFQGTWTMSMPAFR